MNQTDKEDSDFVWLDAIPSPSTQLKTSSYTLFGGIWSWFSSDTKSSSSEAISSSPASSITQPSSEPTISPKLSYPITRPRLSLALPDSVPTISPKPSYPITRSRLSLALPGAESSDSDATPLQQKTPLANQNIHATSTQSKSNKQAFRQQWEKRNPKIAARVYHPNGQMCEIRIVNKKQFAYWDESLNTSLQVQKIDDKFQTPGGNIVFTQSVSNLAPR